MEDIQTQEGARAHAEKFKLKEGEFLGPNERVLWHPDLDSYWFQLSNFETADGNKGAYMQLIEEGKITGEIELFTDVQFTSDKAQNVWDNLE